MMKKCALLLVLLVLFAAPAQCESVQYDVSEMDETQLLALRDSVNARLRELGAYPFTALKRGGKGEEVTALQERLAALGYYGKTVDGSYNTATQSAMKAFEKQNGLKQDGAASVLDQQVLFAPSAASKPTPTPSPTPRPTATPRRAHAYPDMDFRAVGLSPEKYLEQRLALSGYVVEAVQEGEALRLRVATDGKTGNIVYVTAPAQAFLLAQDDFVSCCGVFKGLYTYLTQAGLQVTLPHVAAEILEKVAR